MKEALRTHLLQSYSEEDLTRWFDPLDLTISEEKQQVVIGFPHAFFSQWFKTEIQDKFEAQLNLFLGNGYRLLYPGDDRLAPGRSPVSVPKVAKTIDFPFDAQFTFESFLINKKNYFPLASAREVAKQSGAMFNPFVVCGKGGTGKTHLMRAVANELSKENDYSKIYLSSMSELNALYSVKFNGDFIRARDFLFGHDFLFVDDLQQLRGFPSMQQELVNIFNHFYDNKKQMVFTCLDKVSTLEFLDSSLQSRLGWGLIVTLKEPDLEIRAGYIQKACKQKRMPLSKEQVLTLAQRFKDFRHLQGILLKLFAFRELVKKDLTQRDFEHILTNTEEKAHDDITPKRIMQVVADHFDVTVKELQGVKRLKQIATARQVAMYLCRDLLSLSYPVMGREFGGKDHSTVLYSVKKIQKEREVNADMKQLLKELKKKCRQSVP